MAINIIGTFPDETVVFLFLFGNFNIFTKIHHLFCKVGVLLYRLTIGTLRALPKKATKLLTNKTKYEENIMDVGCSTFSWITANLM